MCKRLIGIGWILLLSVALCISAVGAEQGARSWYCVRNKHHKQPVADPDMRFIEQYNGYYIDHAHGDGNADKVIYLTFDAGYENGNVAKILDTLQAEDVQGAFFVLGHLITQNTTLVRRMVDEGHLVCNHTLRHRDMTRISSKEEFAKELTDLETLYAEKIGGQMPRYYRPPEGRFDERSMRYAAELGYKTIFWSFAYADWDNQKQPDPTQAKQKILDHIHNGAVLLLHPTSATNAAILGDVIRALKAEGYRFGTLDELTAEGA